MKSQKVSESYLLHKKPNINIKMEIVNNDRLIYNNKQICALIFPQMSVVLSTFALAIRENGKDIVSAARIGNMWQIAFRKNPKHGGLTYLLSTILSLILTSVLLPSLGKISRSVTPMANERKSPRIEQRRF